MFPQLFFKLINFYAPLFGAGIKVVKVNKDFNIIDVEMGLNRFNKNVVGTQFGGSLYAMCDPFFMAILMTKLGRDFIVWDKSARIEFLKPGRTKVKARFEIPLETIEAIRAEALVERKVEPEFVVEILDTNGIIVARVHKTLYVRRKS